MKATMDSHDMAGMNTYQWIDGEEGSASLTDFGAPPAAPEVADGSLSMSPLSTAAPGDIDSEDVFVEGSHCSV
ncbi:hypothetical protein AK812_SmicGene42050 [Symbiodinium microadriaticum]|uniref:Uncharacterized protein n=1 Tax=Symbiodinium microadriaticum TaxID=2951 RepID=A0A1Q9C4J2_SYMMI|nr:hypothetical protein AK812_SmicGene42050 [Symbiodinium microadriaticum]